MIWRKQLEWQGIWTFFGYSLVGFCVIFEPAEKVSRVGLCQMSENKVILGPSSI